MKKIIILILVFFILSLSSPAKSNSFPIATRFDYPVKPIENYNTTWGCDWLETSRGSGPLHPGTDFNDNSKLDMDFGDPVYAVGNGIVVYAQVGRFEWGRIVLIEHHLLGGEIVWSQYAHLRSMFVKVGDVVKRGDQIGTIGKGANEIYFAHLHFEIRYRYRVADAWTFGLIENQIVSYYYNPIEFLDAHRRIDSEFFKKMPKSHGLSEIK